MEHSISAVKQRFGIIGFSPLLENALNTAIRVAETDLSVLITGESGVGKEVFSKLIHELSTRKHNKFIAINTGAIPEGTINSELFGHEKGSFTGASSDRKGYFETVNGGTIFLDEIGEMPLDTQAFLLRILESGEYLRMGSSQIKKTDVRIIAATNVPLLDAIKRGKFREDLYYRLSTVPIHVPPLRDRGDDVLILFRKFAQDFAEKYNAQPVRLFDEAQATLKQYTWPGNIRELKNFVEQISVLYDRKTIDREDLLQYLPKARTRNLPVSLEGNYESQRSIEEREILYKFLFEMKTDLKDLRSLVFELISNNELDVRNSDRLQRLTTIGSNMDINLPSEYYSENQRSGRKTLENMPDKSAHTPIILSGDEQSEYHNSEVIEENLSLEYMEKIMIRKALKKHSGRRKDAADDLGISERTLYRKLDKYNINDL